MFTDIKTKFNKNIFVINNDLFLYQMHKIEKSNVLQNTSNYSSKNLLAIKK